MPQDGFDWVVTASRDIGNQLMSDFRPGFMPGPGGGGGGSSGGVRGAPSPRPAPPPPPAAAEQSLLDELLGQASTLEAQTADTFDLAAEEFSKLLNPMSDFQQLISQEFDYGKVLLQSAEEAAAEVTLSDALVTAGRIGGVAELLAFGLLQPGELSSSDYTGYLPDAPAPDRSGNGPTGTLNDPGTLPDVIAVPPPSKAPAGFNFDPAGVSLPGQSPFPWAPIGSQTGPMPMGRSPRQAPKTQTLGQTQGPFKNLLTRFSDPMGRSALATLTDMSKIPPEVIKATCNSGKKKGKCRQGYFREKSSGDIQLITWSTRKCPSSSPLP
jgi:hypothetical protein